MSGNSPDDIDPVERVLDMIREYYADPEVMAAWGSADAEGQIHHEAAQVIDRYKMRWRRGSPAPVGHVSAASIAARQIAEGKYSSPADPELRASLERIRALLKKDSR